MLRPPFVRQSDDKSCGLCCVKANLRYWGCDSDIPKFERALVPKKHGLDAFKIEEIYRRYGWFVSSGSMTIKTVSDYTEDGIAVQCLINFENCGHYVLVFHVDRAKVKFMCPMRGIVTQKIEKFLRSWESAYADLDLLFPFYGIVSFR